MKRFAGEEFLHDLTFDFDAVTVLCHGFSSRKPGYASQFLVPICSSQVAHSKVQNLFASDEIRNEIF